LRKLALIVLTALWPVLWIARTHELDGLTRFLVPTFVLSIFATVLAWGGASPRAARLASAAFGSIAAGDVALNLTPWPAAAVPAFLCAHLCLAAAFLRERRLRTSDLPWLVPPAIAALLFARHELPRLAGAGSFAGLAVYLVVLTAMLWRGLCPTLSIPCAKRIARSLGAALFFATDLFSIATYVEATRVYIAWIWALYPPALLCLAWSFWAAPRPPVSRPGRADSVARGIS
jgi:hypothetical protein